VTVPDRSDGKHAAIGIGDLRAKLLLVVLCLIWGVSWPVMKIALEDIPPLSMRAMSAGVFQLRDLGARHESGGMAVT